MLHTNLGRTDHEQIQAICDRVLLDCANIVYLASQLPDGAGGEPTPAGVTVAQLIAHLAFAADGHAAILRAIRLGQPVDFALANSEAALAEHAESAADVAIDTAIALLRRSERAFMEQLLLFPGRFFDGVVEGREMAPLVSKWSLHYVRHGLDFVDAVPALRTDSMALNWLLFADFRRDESLRERQLQLFAFAKELAAAEAKGEGNAS